MRREGEAQKQMEIQTHIISTHIHITQIIHGHCSTFLPTLPLAATKNTAKRYSDALV